MTQESPVAPRSPAAGLLRAAGLRITNPRIAVVEHLQAHPHIDAETVTLAVRDRLGAVSAQAVYDVLAALCRAGLVRRIEPAGSAALFERRTGDDHHHVVCRRCGAVDDVDRVPRAPSVPAVPRVPAVPGVGVDTGAAACLTPADPRGFMIEQAEVTFWGVCPACRLALGSPGSLRPPGVRRCGRSDAGSQPAR